MGMKQTNIDGQYMKTKYLKIRDKNGESNYAYQNHWNHQINQGITSDERHIGATFGTLFDTLFYNETILC